MPRVADAVRMFAPERWGEVTRFRQFWSSTYALDNRAQRALAGVESHLDKCLTLSALAKGLSPNLQIDNSQLNERGFTPADNAHEIATVIEAAILELYSSVDCTAKVLRALFGAETRGFKDSTRGLFRNVSNMSGSLPEPVKLEIQGADWYWDLLKIRDELTHLATGSIHLDQETNCARYHHYGITKGDKPLMVDDIFNWLDCMTREVNQFLGTIFHHLNSLLNDRSIFQVCGMTKGRLLHRFVSPVGDLTFNSGICGAWVWFEKSENPACPFKEQCGAYLRVRQKNC